MECNLKMQNILEGIAIKWSYLINDVVIDTSEKFFMIKRDGQLTTMPSPPAPLTEITFWNERHANLANLYAQLVEPRRKMVGQMLEKISSVYYTAFRQAFQHTITALVQARDVCVYLNALTEPIHAMQNTLFHEWGPLIRPMLHCLCLMWRESKHYPAANWPLLFKMMANMLIVESTKNFDPDTLFQSDVEDTMMKIDETVIILKLFKYVPLHCWLLSAVSGWFFVPRNSIDRINRITTKRKWTIFSIILFLLCASAFSPRKERGCGP